MDVEAACGSGMTDAEREIAWCEEALASSQRSGWQAGIAHYEERLARAKATAWQNPRLGPEYPHITHWRCAQCGRSFRIAGAKERAWCMACPDGHPLTLLTHPQPGKTADDPASNWLPKS